MRRLRAWFFRIAGIFRKERGERELTAEMESHLQLHIEDNLRAGMSAEEARRQALIKLGVEQTRKPIEIEGVCRCSRHFSRICASPPACYVKTWALQSSSYSHSLSASAPTPPSSAW